MSEVGTSQSPEDLAARLDAFDLNDDDQFERARNTILGPAIEARDYDRIDRYFAALIERRPDRYREKIDRIDYALMGGRKAQASALLDQLGVRCDTKDAAVPGWVHGAVLRILLQLDRYDEACQLARLYLPDFRADKTMALMALRAFERAGEESEVLETARAVRNLAEDDHDALGEMAFYLVNRRRANLVRDLLGGIAVPESDNFRLLSEYGRAMLQTHSTDPQIVDILEKAVALKPEDRQARLQLSRALARLGRDARALEVLEYDPETIDDEQESFRAQVAEALMLNDRNEDAMRLYRRLVEDNPHHGGWRRALVSASLRAGHEDDAKTHYKEDLASRDLSDYADFEAALRGLDNRIERGSIPAARFEWAWRKLDQIGCRPADREAWERANIRNNLADHLTLNWIETRPQDAGQILERMDGLEEAIDRLREETRDGMGVFLAAAHIGALFAGPVGLANSDLDYRWVASTPSVSNAPGAKNLLSTYSQNRMRLAKKIFGAVREGAVVSLAIDGSSSVAARPIDYEGDHILLSDFVPRAVYQLGVKCFFPQVVWVGDRVQVRLEEMIMPRPIDTLDAFIPVWFTDFTRILSETFCSYPDSLRLSGGFWREIAL